MKASRQRDKAREASEHHYKLAVSQPPHSLNTKTENLLLAIYFELRALSAELHHQTTLIDGDED